MFDHVARETVRKWLANEVRPAPLFFSRRFFCPRFSSNGAVGAQNGADNGILYFVLNGVQYRTAHFPRPLPPAPQLSVVFDCLKLAAHHAQLCHFIVLRHYFAELFFEEQVARMLGVSDIVVFLRPVSLPYPQLHLTSLAAASRVQRGCLFQIRLRLLEIGPVEYRGEEEHRIASQLCRVCMAHSNVGAREEMHHATLRMSNDLLSICQEKHVGEVIEVVAHTSCYLNDKGMPIAVLQAVFVQKASMLGSPTRMLAGSSTPTRTFRYVLHLSNMLRDPGISETGSTDYFRLSLLLSSVISQSRSTTHPVHLLACGDVLQDVDRMMRVTANSCVATVFTPPSLHQMLHAALALTVRGVCRVNDLQDMVARQSALSNKLVEFLNSATAANCGTLWAQMPRFGKATEAPLDKDFPILARNGLSRCFALVHRCATPNESSVVEMRRKRSNEGIADDAFEPEVFRESITAAVLHMDRTNISATPEAARLMEDFVLVSRRLRNQTTSEVSIHAVGLLFVLARAHAALCLRSAVTEEDATVAIYLLEESLLARTGKSLLSFSPFLGCGKSNLTMYAGLNELHSHIKRLIISHIPRED